MIKIADLERVEQYEELGDNELSFIYGGKWNWMAILGVTLAVVTVGLVAYDNLKPPEK